MKQLIFLYFYIFIIFTHAETVSMKMLKEFKEVGFSEQQIFEVVEGKLEITPEDYLKLRKWGYTTEFIKKISIRNIKQKNSTTNPHSPMEQALDKKTDTKSFLKKFNTAKIADCIHYFIKMQQNDDIENYALCCMYIEKKVLESAATANLAKLELYNAVKEKFGEKEAKKFFPQPILHRKIEILNINQQGKVAEILAKVITGKGKKLQRSFYFIRYKGYWKAVYGYSIDEVKYDRYKLYKTSEFLLKVSNDFEKLADRVKSGEFEQVVDIQIETMAIRNKHALNTLKK